MPRNKLEYNLLQLFKKFINELKKGKRLQTNGKRVKRTSIKNYEWLEKLLTDFSIIKSWDLKLKNTTRLSKNQFESEKKYWNKFYLDFTSYLYDDLGHFDNNVGRMMKLLRCFFNYLNNEKNLHIGSFHKKFYAPSEDIEIMVLSAERLNELIYNEEKEKLLSENAKKVKDFFVFGCAVGLRFSDLSALNTTNLEIMNNKMYIKVNSKKTQTFSRVKLPPYAIDIINKYRNTGLKTLLPVFSKNFINQQLKMITELYGYTETIGKFRQKRGIRTPIYKGINGKGLYRFCDLVSTHTMRRTAITLLLSEGLNEKLVRQISGHSPNSKEFFRYVSFAQSFFDEELEKVHEKLKNKVFDEQKIA